MMWDGKAQGHVTGGLTGMMWDGKAQGHVTGGADEDDVGRKGKRVCDWGMTRMMWDGKAKGHVTGGVDEDDVGRKGKRACDSRADGTRMRRAGRTEKERIRRLSGRMRSLSD